MIGLTVFRDLSARTAEHRAMPWPDFVRRVREAQTYPAKAACPLLSLCHYGDATTPSGSLRHAANVVEVHGIEGDHDAGTMTPIEAADKLRAAGVAALIVTTASHTIEAPRWRVLAPLSQPVAPADRAQWVATLNGLLGGVLASESFTLSQAFYVGRVEGAAFDLHEVEGDTIDTSIAASFTTPIYPPTAARIEHTPDDREAPPLDVLQSAVRAIRNDGTDPARDWHWWRRVITSIKAADDTDAGRALALEFSEQHPEHNPEEFGAQWRRADPSKGIGVGTVLHAAAADGWVDPRHAAKPASAEGFEFDAPPPSGDDVARDIIGAIKASKEAGRAPRDIVREAVGRCAAARLGPVDEREVLQALKDATGIAVAELRRELRAVVKARGETVGNSATRSDDVAAAAAGETFGDLSNGRRFAAKYRDRFVYCESLKSWHEFDGARWIPAGESGPMAAAKAVAQEALDAAVQALKERPTDTAKANLSAALGVVRKIQRIAGMLTSAASEPGMSIKRADEFDRDPMLLGVRNGVLDLRTGQLIAARPSQFITKQAGASFDPRAVCPRFEQFMHDIFNGDAELIRYVQRCVGYSLTGLVGEEVFFFLLGRGANGKSVFANVLAGVFGDYCVSVRPDVMIKGRQGGGEGARDMTKLVGARLAFVNEVSLSDVFDDQAVKTLTSNDPIPARLLYSEGFTFAPTHTMWIRANHKPGVHDAGDAFWRRVRMLSFERQFSEAERVPDLHKQLLEERDGILTWALAGCLEYQRAGLQTPASVSRDVDAYRLETDVFGEFLRTCCVTDPAAKTAPGSLYQRYVEFMSNYRMHAVSRVAFGRELGSRGFKQRKSNGREVWAGVRLQTFEETANTEARALFDRVQGEPQEAS